MYGAVIEPDGKSSDQKTNKQNSKTKRPLMIRPITVLRTVSESHALSGNARIQPQGFQPNEKCPDCFKTKSCKMKVKSAHMPKRLKKRAHKVTDNELARHLFHPKLRAHVKRVARKLRKKCF